MTNNNNKQQVKFNLTSIARWKAFCRKHNVVSKDEIMFVSNQPSYVKRWLLDGVGTPYSQVLNCDVLEALKEAEVTVDSLTTLDIEEVKMILDYCYKAL